MLHTAQHTHGLGQTNQRLFIIALALLLVTMCTASASAWGGATHIQLAHDVLSQAGLLPAAVATALLRYRRAFMYGNVAADMVLAKKLSRVKQVCHQWQTGFSILNRAGGEQEQAFAYGYLAHLAADTVAHNKYLPHQFALSRTTHNFGHLYWELRADSHIEPVAWAALRATLRGDYPGPIALLRQHLNNTLLSFGTNRHVFNQMNMLSSMRGWRASVSLWSRVSRWPLASDTLARFRAESLGRIMDVLTRQTQSSVLKDDPNGNRALQLARAQRRHISRMRRTGLPTEDWARRVASVHAPADQAADPRRF